MKYIIYSLLALALTGCVAGAPILTDEQTKKMSQIEIFKSDNKPSRNYDVLGAVSAADCSGPGGSRLYGNETKSIEILIKKSAVLNADAVVDISCSGVPYVNNCWLAEKCDGNAVKWK